MLQQFDFICSTRQFWDILKTFVWVSHEYSQLTLEMVQKSECVTIGQFKFTINGMLMTKLKQGERCVSMLASAS